MAALTVSNSPTNSMGSALSVLSSPSNANSTIVPGRASSASTTISVPSKTPAKTTSSSSPTQTSAGSATSDTSADNAIVGQAQTALTQALNALNASNSNVASQEKQQENELDSNEASQNNTYQDTLTKNAQNLTGAETAARTQGNGDLNSLDRLLGSLGAGGSSVETEEIPQLVNKTVAGNISNAGTTAGQNEQSANVAWNNFLDELGSQRQQLTDDSNQQIATNNGTNGKISSAIQQIIAAAKSGSIDPSDLNYELQSVESEIPAATSFTPSFSGTTPVYATPSLSNFTLTPSQIAAASGTVAPVSGSAVIPYLASLTNNQKQTVGAAS